MIKLVLIKWSITLSPVLSKWMFGCSQTVAGDGSVIFQALNLDVSFYAGTWANPHFSFIIASTVTLHGEPQSYNTSPTTCCVMPSCFGRVFCGGFEGAIRFDLAAKWWRGTSASLVPCLVSTLMSHWVSLEYTFCRVDSLINVSEVHFDPLALSLDNAAPYSVPHWQ